LRAELRNLGMQRTRQQSIQTDSALHRAVVADWAPPGRWRREWLASVDNSAPARLRFCPLL